MQEIPEPLTPMAALPAERKGRSLDLVLGILAWVTIVVLVVWEVQAQMERPRQADAGGEDRLGTMLMEMEGRYFTGAVNFLPTDKNGRMDLYKQAAGLNAGPVGQRLRFVILAGELVEPEEAQKQLADLEGKLARANIDLTPDQRRMLDSLKRLYQDQEEKKWDLPSLSAEDRNLLRTRLGWYGDLALTPAASPDTAARAAVLQPALRTMVSIIGLVVLVGVLGVAGLSGIAVMTGLWLVGKLRGGLGYRIGHGGVYAETFALWLGLLVGLSLAASWIPIEQNRLLLSTAVMVLSLIALVWPVLRGVPWRQVRQDIGLTAGRQPLLEPFLGIGVYAMALPLLLVGLIVTFFLLRLQAGLPVGGNGDSEFNMGDMPAHPIIGYVSRADWWGKLQVLFLAAVVAPLVEETMFRGVLYRHLRELGAARLGGFVSVVASGLVVSFIFAVIHPQGLAAVPALMALAFAFSLAREWRGTLIPGMVAHGINNALLMLLFMLAMGE